MKNSPCYGCERRQPGCQNADTCEDWRKYAEENERRRAAAQKHRELEEYKVQSMRRYRKLNER